MNWPTFVASFPASIPELEVREEVSNVLCSSEGLAWQSDKKYKRTVTRVNDLHINNVLGISNGVQKDFNRNAQEHCYKNQYAV